MVFLETFWDFTNNNKLTVKKTLAKNSLNCLILGHIVQETIFYFIKFLLSFVTVQLY